MAEHSFVESNLYEQVDNASVQLLPINNASHKMLQPSKQKHLRNLHRTPKQEACEPNESWYQKPLAATSVFSCQAFGMKAGTTVGVSPSARNAATSLLSSS